jgi:hypothetical protein
MVSPSMGSEALKEGTGAPFVHIQAGSPTRFLEYFHQSCSDETKCGNRGLFGVHRYFFSINALCFVPGFPGEKSRVVLSGFSAAAQETRGRKEC